MIASLLPPLLAAATAKPPKPVGVWRGTLGKQAIVACFDEYDGRYYYESRRHDITLHGEGESLVEQEAGSEPTGSWRISSVSAEFVATWSSRDGKRVLPIRMKPLARIGKDGSCDESTAYDGPRLASALLAPAITKTEQGVRVRRERVRDADLERVQVDLPGPAGERINGDLAQDFRDSLGTAYSCADYSSSTSVAYADARWLVVLEGTDLYCGGAHPEDFSRVLVYERANGRRVDTSEWLTDADPSGYERLWALLAKKAALEPECKEVWEGNIASDLRVWPSAEGVTFLPDFPHVVSTCEAQVEISVEQALPFLTPAAKRLLSPSP